MNELEKRAAYHRKRLKGLSPFCSLGESKEHNIVVYNGTNKENFDYSTIDLNNSREIGLHCGTEQACRDRGYKFVNKLILKSPNVLSLPFDVTSIWSSIELVRRMAQYDLFDEKQLESLENQMRKCADDPDKYLKYSKLLRDFFLDKGYNVISYTNEIEDAGSISYIILDTSIISTDVGETMKLNGDSSSFSEEISESLSRRDLDNNRIKIARAAGVTTGDIQLWDNGRFEIHNVKEDDLNRCLLGLRKVADNVRHYGGRYDFSKVPTPGSLYKRLFTIQGNLKETMNESMSDINWLDSSVKTIRDELSNLPEGAKLIIKVSNAHIYDEDTWKTMPITYIMTKKDDSKLTSSMWSYIKEEVSYKGAINISMGQLSEIISSGGNKNFGDIDSVEVVDTLTEKKKKKKSKYHINYNAGNVEHNINMFNHMSSPIDGPANNPISGPMGGNVDGADASTACCEAFWKKKDSSPEHTVYRFYYTTYDDPFTTFEIDIKADNADEAEDIFYRNYNADDDKTISNYKEIHYRDTRPASSNTSDEARYYIAKYRGANTGTLHKVYFRCDGFIEDAVELLDSLIPEPYTDSRVLGTASKAGAERDGFTLIGEWDSSSLDDDFNMTSRTLW